MTAVSWPPTGRKSGDSNMTAETWPPTGRKFGESSMTADSWPPTGRKFGESSMIADSWPPTGKKFRESSMTADSWPRTGRKSGDSSMTAETRVGATPGCFRVRTPSTLQQRTVRLVLNNHQWRSSVLNLGDNSSLQKYQGRNKKSGHWLLKYELDNVNTRSACDHIKWPMEMSVEDLLCYPHGPKEASLLVDKDKTTCTKTDDSYRPCFDNQQTNECKLSNISKHDGDSKDNDGLSVPIFVKHTSGELTMTINLNQSCQHLMHLYALKTKTKLECQYFVYRTKILEPHGSLLFYGVERDTTVYVCTRLLGGMVTIKEYLVRNKKKLLVEVTLPDGRVSLMMTKEGCLFLSTWLKCFTRAFADSKSWEGDFSLDDFKVTNHHVVVIKSAGRKLTRSSMNADLTKLIGYIKNIFMKKSDGLVSEFPPYLENLTSFLGALRLPTLLETDRLFIETHMCCVESSARGILLVLLRRKQKSLNRSVQMALDAVITRQLQPGEWEYGVGYSSAYTLNETAVFDDIIAYGNSRNEPYTDSKASTFRLMRDEYMHAPSNRFDKSSDTWKEKYKNDDGIELLIPAYNPDLIPNAIYRWIGSNNVEIKQELLAAQVRCTCRICYPQGHKGGGESSTSGKGKQPESPGPSQPSRPSSGQGSNVGAGTRVPPSAWQRQGHLLQDSRASQWEQPQQGASSRMISQPAAPHHRPAHARTQQSSTSELEPGWEIATRKGKGKRS